MSKARSVSNYDFEGSATESVETYDAVVLGGGPAGSAAALSLSREGLSVALLERSGYNQDRIGETLPPAVKTILTSLGVWEEFHRLNSRTAPIVCSAWGSETRHTQDHIFNPYGPGWQIDRTRFDAMLACCAQTAGARLYTDVKLTSCSEDHANNWLLKLESPHRLRLQTGFLVDATGRASTVARRQQVRRLRFDQLIAVISFLMPTDTNANSDSFALIEAVEAGWWYSAVVPDSRLAIAYMTDADLYAKARRSEENFWRQQLELTNHTQLRARGYRSPGPFRIVAADSSRLALSANENWIAIGDAAVAFDPLSGQGVYRALESGIAGAQAVHDYLRGNRAALQGYCAAVEKTFDDYLQMRKNYYSKEQRWSSADFWKRRSANQAGSSLALPLRVVF